MSRHFPPASHASRKFRSESATQWAIARKPRYNATTAPTSRYSGRNSTRRSRRMSDEALLVVRVLFWVLTAGLALLPMRWATVCLILASHIDITSLTFASATSVGFENTVRIAVLPLLFLAR